MIELLSPAELKRLLEIGQLSLTVQNDDPEITKIVEDAAMGMGLPIALVSIVTDGAQFFFEQKGLGGWIEETRGTPVEWSFCQHVVSSEAPFAVENAETNELVNSSPLISNDGIRCYLGVPIRSKSGAVLGSLCVIGTETREFKDDEVKQLETFSSRLTELIEKRRAQVA